MFEWGGMRLVTVVTPSGKSENRCADHPDRSLPPIRVDCPNCTAMQEWQAEFAERYGYWKATGRIKPVDLAEYDAILMAR